MTVTTADRSIESLHPVAQKACRLFLDECKKAGLDIFLTETYRSKERQKWLYAQGRTRFPGPIVTWTLNSNHMSKLAWDIAVNPPKDLYDTATLNKAGAIAKRLGIEWGGDWRPTIDRPHFQVTANWKAPVTTAANPKPSEEDDEMAQLLSGTAKKDMKNLLQRAFDDKVFSVNHASKVDTMTRGEATDLLISYVARAK